ncbi:unnamed protein product [Pieris macdunnoughi]|uniref:Uncharacterized protein n=1 Tax=Pieris macdunnoughi TaxID=345717 RepID=A0A821QHK7_9NEOP|nr:unnamed protein product [Pieris macdunnoughi]
MTKQQFWSTAQISDYAFLCEVGKGKAELGPAGIGASRRGGEGRLDRPQTHGGCAASGLHAHKQTVHRPISPDTNTEMLQ